jgi:hypothetical protein
MTAMVAVPPFCLMLLAMRAVEEATKKKEGEKGDTFE